MPTPEETAAAMATTYTSSSNGKTTPLGELPLPYLKNIQAKLTRSIAPVRVPNEALLAALTIVVDAKAAEADAREAALAAEQQHQRGE